MSLLEEVLPEFRAGKRIRLGDGPWLDPNTYKPPWSISAMSLSGLVSDKWEVDTDVVEKQRVNRFRVYVWFDVEDSDSEHTEADVVGVFTAAWDCSSAVKRLRDRLKEHSSLDVVGHGITPPM